MRAAVCECVYRANMGEQQREPESESGKMRKNAGKYSSFAYQFALAFLPLAAVRRSIRWTGTAQCALSAVTVSV